MPNLTDIMRRAHAIGRHYRGEITFADALRRSWAIARGYSAGFETSYVDAEHRVYRASGFAGSTDESRRDRIALHNDLVRRGFKPIGSNEFSLRRFMPVQQGIETAPVALKHAA
jgi:hypothetical protein